MSALEGRSVAVVAAAGAIASEVARQAAAEGARVHLAARTVEQAETLGEELRAAGGQVARVDGFDATDPEAVEAWFATLGPLDGVFNGIGPRAHEAGYGTPASTLAFPTFMLPLEQVVGSQFLTARCAAGRMASGGSVVLLSASLSGVALPMMAGITAACGALEALTRALAADLAAQGVRVNCVRADAMAATRTIRETSAAMARAMGQPEGGEGPDVGANLIGRPLTTGDAAAEVIHLLSGRSAGVNAQVRDVTGGTVLA